MKLPEINETHSNPQVFKILEDTKKLTSWTANSINSLLSFIVRLAGAQLESQAAQKWGHWYWFLPIVVVFLLFSLISIWDRHRELDPKRSLQSFMSVNKKEEEDKGRRKKKRILETESEMTWNVFTAARNDDKHWSAAATVATYFKITMQYSITWWVFVEFTN